jgi:hypothetical protein
MNFSIPKFNSKSSRQRKRKRKKKSIPKFNSRVILVYSQETKSSQQRKKRAKM